MTDHELDQRFERWVMHHVETGEESDAAALCADRPDLLDGLQTLIAGYRSACAVLDGAWTAPTPAGAVRDDGAELPVFDGFRTIERIGGGGAGHVYKLFDLTLNRMVAGKVLHDGERLAGVGSFLREARALALFDDPRIVRIFEFRADHTPPVLVTELVDGFDLGRVAPSLEVRQRVRIVQALCEAVAHAHDLGVQHRDLKPSNVMLDAQMMPRILDFGLSGADPTAGHFRGTPQYLAPEQLDPSAAIDTRSDVYGLGAILYELLCGVPPIAGGEVADVVARVRAGAIRLPADVRPGVPEPLQAIALKALERRPDDRYPSAREMGLDLSRYLDGRAVDARPSQYATALSTRVQAHLDHIQEWVRLKLVYPHEAASLRTTYAQLNRRDDDWIGEARLLSYSQIALYLGAFLLMCGSLFYFGAHRFHEAVRGVLRPFLVLAVPFLGLNAAAPWLAQRGHRAVAVAFYLGGVSLLPLFLLILFHETGLWVVVADTAGQLFTDGSVSNRQLQVTTFVAGAWTTWLALRTRTLALSTVSVVLVLLFALALLTDAGLRGWVDQEQWDALASHLMPLVPAYAMAAFLLERSGRPWFGRPFYTGAGVLLIVVLELFALDGRMFHALGVSLKGWQAADVSDPLLLDTLAALSINGLVFYAVAAAAERHASPLVRPASWLLFSVSPFAVLEPLARLSHAGEYGRGADWLYLALAVTAALASHRRQRRSFYYAGLINVGIALYFIADHYQWFDCPLWAVVLIGLGLAALLLGYGLAARERRPGGAGRMGA